MFKFFRRSKRKSTQNDAKQTHKNSKNEQLQNLTQDTINIDACARSNRDDINKTQEKLKFADHIDHSVEVVVQKDRRINDNQQAPSERYEFKKEISSRNEIVDQKQCQIENVSKRSIPIDRKSIKQDQQSQSERNHLPHKLSFNPISKGREFFNEIMAKGRNRHRNRNKNKDSKNQVNTYQDTNYEQKQGELSCDKTDSPATEDYINARENFQFGYQITKSKNSMNLVMRSKEEDEHGENDDGRDEHDQSSSSNSNETTESNGGNTSNDQDDICAGANDEVLDENRIRVGQPDEHCEHNYNESNNSELRQQKVKYYSSDQDERANYEDRAYCAQNVPHTIEEFASQERQHPQDFIEVQSNVEAEQISELTECDRDRYFKREMGQPNSKTSSTSSKNQTNTSNLDRSHIIIPIITVADYSDHDKGSGNEPDIFYDSEQSFDTDSDHIEKPIEIVDLSNEVKNSTNNNNKNNNEEWHFVTNESGRVTIDDDPDPNIDHIISINSNSENLSTTSFSATEIQTGTPDSGLGSTGNILLIDSRTIVNDSENQLNSGESDSFLRGSSTDCDENLLQSDFEIIYDNDDHDIDSNCQPILIDSISLPDVVVESTGMGTSSSLPIKIEPVEDISTRCTDAAHPKIAVKNQKNIDKRDLVNQEARFSAQLEDAQKTALNAQSKVNELQAKIEELEKELSTKSWNVDRLQAELDSAEKEDVCVRQRLNVLGEEKETLSQRFADTEAEFNSKYEELENDYKALQDKYEKIQILSKSLQTQLAFAQSDAEQCRLEKKKLQKEKDEELKTLHEALEKSHQEKKHLEEKWHNEFETLRTQNADKEEQLLKDCEWQMRTMQKGCKEKLGAAEKAKEEALERATEAETKLEEQAETFRHLKCCEAELRQLRGLTNDQRQSIVSMTEQLEDLRADLESANEELEEQIGEVRKIKKQCEMTLSIKDREMIQKIEEARGEVALQWESKLLTEMTRLKSELETVQIEDRQEALHKLQEEHIEELKVLTTRYIANEQELRDEIESLHKELEERDIDYRELKEKTDAALLETRLHLERADHDYQRAMNREEHKREALCEEMRKEFEKEKLEMEEQFRERIGQVKEEFAKELSHATEELTIKHRKQLELQWEQLIAEKEEALQAVELRHRIRLEEADNRIKDLEIEHQRDLKELKNNFDIERTSLESRDLQNSQEIEQLHRKCRCLTNLFEEMRMRYERRDPRPEDLQEISELRSRCESQERDLQLLTERLRDMQIQLQEQQPESQQTKKRLVKKPPSKTIPTSCDVIYEENEDRDSPPKENGVNGTTTNELIENMIADS